MPAMPAPTTIASKSVLLSVTAGLLLVAGGTGSWLQPGYLPAEGGAVVAQSPVQPVVGGGPELDRGRLQPVAGEPGRPGQRLAGRRQPLRRRPQGGDVVERVALPGGRPHPVQRGRPGRPEPVRPG